MIETTVVIAVIVGVVEAIKKLGMSSKFAPALSLALGVVAIAALDGFTAINVFAGLIAGLSAAGLYSGGKTILK